MKTNNLSKRRVRRIVSCFAAGLTAIDTSFKLKLHRNTINKYYRQIREAIAEHETDRLNNIVVGTPDQTSKILWHKNQGLCLSTDTTGTNDVLAFYLVNIDEKIYVLQQGFYESHHTLQSGVDSISNNKTANSETDEDALAQFSPLANRFYHYSKEKLTKFYGVKPQYTFLYLQELEFRFNNHDTNISNLILKLLADQEKGFRGGSLGEDTTDSTSNE